MEGKRLSKAKRRLHQSSGLFFQLFAAIAALSSNARRLNWYNMNINNGCTGFTSSGIGEDSKAFTPIHGYAKDIWTEAIRCFALLMMNAMLESAFCIMTN